MKKSIIIYADCIAILEELTYEQAGRLFKAILSYINEEPVTEIEDDPAIRMAFKVLKTQIDRDAEKYESICKKRSEAGAKGNAKRWAKKSKEVANVANAIIVSQKSQEVANVADNDSDSDSESTNVDNILPSSLRSEGSSHSKADATHPKSFREKVLLYFNGKMAGKSIKPIKAITDGTKRSEYLKARVREHGRDAVFQMIDKAAGSQFLNGYNQKGFTATFDWLVLPNNFIKVLEGNYDNERNGTDRKNNGAEQRADEAADIIARLAAEDDSAAGK
jgi:hypothetical protein